MTHSPKFRVGDKVFLSSYPKMVGTIMEIELYESYSPDYEIRWEDGSQSFFSENDIELHDETVTMVTDLIKALKENNVVDVIKLLRDLLPTPTPTLTVNQAVSCYMAQSISHLSEVSGLYETDLYDELMKQLTWRNEPLPTNRNLRVEVINNDIDIDRSPDVRVGHINPNLSGLEWRPYVEESRKR